MVDSILDRLLEFRVQYHLPPGFGLRDVGFRVPGSGFRVPGSGFVAPGSRFPVSVFLSSSEETCFSFISGNENYYTNASD